MGAALLQQGCLRLAFGEGLVERTHLKTDTIYRFKKDGHRLYMLDTPLELVTEDWKAIARIIIDQITIGKGKTEGSFRVLKVYSDEEERVVSGTFIPYTAIDPGMKK